MSRWRRARSLVRESWERGGVAEVGKELTSYLAWRIAGSPDADISPDHVAMRLNDLESALGVLIYGETVHSLHVDPGTLVSIVLPTRDRKHLLPRSIGSVLAQSYPNWQLLVIDNSEDPIGNMSDDPRVRVIRCEDGGAGRARNLGLAEADGEIITFLDDDNEMGTDWLKAVVSSFQADRSVDVMIGAQVVLPEPGSGGVPSVRYRHDFDWVALTKFNYVDLGMLAHRRKAELTFDESLPALLDWDYVVRLTAEHEPLMVPALSGTYHTDAQGRISYQDRRQLIADLRGRFASIPRPRRGRVSFLTADDQTALDHLVRRLRSRLQRPVNILFTDEKLTALGWGSDADFARSSPPEPQHGQRFDLVLIGPAFAGALPEISEQALIVGYQAHMASYADRFPDLTDRRRVGDQLWIAGKRTFEAEAFLPGNALVKLGDDPPDDEMDDE